MRASREGTAKFRDAAAAAPGHFREALGGLSVSSLGIGTYLGRDDAATDASYAQSVKRALQLGLNVVDTAINYRNQRSERAVGAAIREFPRDQIVLCTKGGYLPFDGGRPHDVRAYLEETFFEPGVLKPDELVAGCHSLAPRYLEDQLRRSLRNLGVDGIDVYYIHNPETQLGEVSRAEFRKRLRKAFEALEKACDDGRVGVYGAATWSGLRLEPDDDGFLALADLLEAAKDAGGAKHHFGAVQLPFNIELDEAATLRNQGDKTLLEAARDAGLAVFASASVMQGRLAQVGGDAQRALQFARSTPGITCALVGMKTPAHVEANAAVARVPVEGE